MFNEHLFLHGRILQENICDLSLNRCVVLLCLAFLQSLSSIIRRLVNGAPAAVL